MLKLHKDLVQGMDIFFVNKQPFLITLTMKIYFTTTAHLPNRKIATIFKEWKRTYVYYFIRGFRIAEVWIDPEFEALFPLIADMKGAPRINATSAKEHVSPVERRIRVVKERARAIKHSLPPKRIPLVMMIAMVLQCTNMLNWFVSKGGISKNFSPFTLLDWTDP